VLFRSNSNITVGSIINLTTGGGELIISTNLTITCTGTGIAGNKVLLISPKTINSPLIQNVGGVIFPLLLDGYPNSVAAYSLRKLSAAYVGNAIRVRRSSDNTELDIGFDINNDLDTATLTTFCSGTNGFVTTWYDQTGNNKNITQITAGNQPQIVNMGTIYTQLNNKPSMYFNKTTSFLSISGFVPNIGNGTRSVFSTFKMIDFAGGLAHIYHTGLASSNQAWGFCSVSNKFGNHYWASTRQGLITPITNNNYIASSIYTGGVDIQYINNTLNLNNTVVLNTGNGTTVIGSRISPYNEGAAFYLGEMVIYNMDQSSNRIGIEGNINKYYNIY
jgi:hypothetical protein